jgi:choline dehydrogenase-like flavoprotein
LYELPFSAHLNKVGSSYHSGGTFPMKLQPKIYETDLNGLLYGTKNIHLIDSSTFPEIPSSTITLTIMANAHRIATRICKY